MSETAPSTKATQSIVVEYDLPEPPEKVWRALTEPQLLARWLMPNDIKPVVGHHFTFRAPPVPGWDGTVHCEVLVVEPHRLLRYSWRGGSDNIKEYGALLDTVATWTLTPTAAGGTHLRLDHDGFPLESFAFTAMNKGWRGKVAERITQVLAETA
jgi:uncharacterized protein YndB with AHSA1/START domain